MRQILRHTFPIVLLFFIVLSIDVRAEPPRPANMPTNEAQLGDAFVEAWTVFRRDLDTLSHGGVHPALMNTWLAETPRFLIRDAAVFSNEPRIVWAAGKLLAKNPSKEDIQILRDLDQQYRNTRLSFKFKGLLIAAGDKKTLIEAEKQLRSPNIELAINAASTLAASGNKSGLAFLRNFIATCGNPIEYTTRLLGLFGTNRELKFLKKTEADGCDNSLLHVAIGEIETKLKFPFHHEMISRRDPWGNRLVSLNGLYDSWFRALGSVIKEGARTSKQVIDGIEKIRRGARSGDDGEVIRRKLKELINFWNTVDGLLRATPPKPQWPASFKDAKQSILRFSSTGKRPQIFAARVSACISVCSAAAKQLEYAPPSQQFQGMRSLTPDGDRVIDGNFATAWRGIEGSKLILVFDTPKKIKELRLANTCADETGSRLLKIKVENTTSDIPWSVVKKMPLHTRYYQKITLNGRKAKQLVITILKIEGTNPACIAEIRVK